MQEEKCPSYGQVFFDPSANPAKIQPQKSQCVFCFFFGTVMSMLFYKPSGCSGFGVSLSISLSAYTSTLLFFFSMMVAGGWYCSNVRSGRNVTPPTPQHTAPHTHTPSTSSFRPSPPVHHPHFRLHHHRTHLLITCKVVFLAYELSLACLFLSRTFTKNRPMCKCLSAPLFVFQCSSLRLRVTTSHSTVKHNSRDMHTKLTTSPAQQSLHDTNDCTWTRQTFRRDSTQTCERFCVAEKHQQRCTHPSSLLLPHPSPPLPPSRLLSPPPPSSSLSLDTH